MDNKTFIEIAVYNPCLLKEIVSSLINVLVLSESVNTVYSFSSEIFYLSIIVQQKVFLGSNLILFFPA